jgi:chloramphenicol 3-O phosphotransferase
MSVVVLLNGVGSAGKTSIARAIQIQASRPFLNMQMDAFLEMMPPRWLGHPDGWVFETIEQDGRPAVVVHSGAPFGTAIRGMRRAIAAMADAGNHVVVDDVFWGDELADYRALLATHDFKAVGVVAPLDVLERRERERGDRAIGLARWQFDRVHAGAAYDLTVDTSAASPEACARQIIDAFGL